MDPARACRPCPSTFRAGSWGFGESEGINDSTVINYERRPEMNGTKKHFGFLVVGLGVGLVAGCAASVFSNEETPGERFRKAIKAIEAACAKRKLAPNEVCGEVAKLKPADPLATEEGRFAHSIKIPNPVPEDSGYRPGMTPQEYFEHLCKTEAGEFIYRTVENVEGLYMMRPRERVFDDHMQHLYALEDPYGHEDWEAKNPENFYVRPGRYRFLEKPLSSSKNPMTAGVRFLRYAGYDGQDSKTMVVQEVPNRKSLYGYTWRGITRPHDRELGIAGGELIVLDLQSNEVLAVRRGFMRSGGVRNLTGIWWPNGQVCRNDVGRTKLFFAVEFISKVLKPQNLASKEVDNASK